MVTALVFLLLALVVLSQTAKIVVHQDVPHHHS